MSKGKGLFSLSHLLVLALFFGFVGVSVSYVYASEGGGNLYPGGNEDFMAGALPPAGTGIFINYLTFYNADRFADNSGHRLPIDFKLDVVANSFRYIHVTKIKALGGDFFWNIIAPVVYQHASLGVGAVDVNTDSRTGLGDVEFGAGIAWHLNKNFHCAAALDMVAPTGNFDKNHFVNIGRNYWSFNPIFAFTYLSDSGFEVSSKMLYWINTTNTDTHYRSGDEFSFDYLVGQHFGKWAVGANGHFLYQTSDDKDHGKVADNAFTGIRDGFKGRYFSLGPAISYSLPKGCITLKYQWDLSAHNRPEGNHIWLKFIHTF